jgi:UDP-N-acetyl-2-amino-2-deoxyglucuronate dehydrogenase
MRGGRIRTGREVQRSMENFAITGVGGYIAERHLKAIRDTGNRLVAALDINDSVGILDRYFPDASFFTEFERFDRFAEKLRRKQPENRIGYVSICTPNYLHDAHIRFALRIGAHAICEKPLVLNPWNLDAIQELEREYGRRVNTILQLRVHPALIDLRDSILAGKKPGKHDVQMTYITSRGPWYLVSWKGQPERSGGVATNIGIHFFDLLIWLFGPVVHNEVHVSETTRAAGFIELERARVRWFLSIDRSDLPEETAAGGKTTFRSITIDQREVEFSERFDDLHTVSYRNALAGNGFGVEDARPSITLAHAIRNQPPVGISADSHPFLKRTAGARR